MNKLEADKYTNEMLSHLSTWAEDNNLELKFKKCLYDPRAGFADITLTVIAEGGMSPEEFDLKDYASKDWTPIKPEWIGSEVTVRGRVAILFGYKPQSRKYPFLVRCGNGDVFKIPESTIVKQLSNKETASADSAV